MSILTSIFNAIFGQQKAAEFDVHGTLEKRAEAKEEKLNWSTSIVDLLKLLDLDSSLPAREKLAKELGYTGFAPAGSAETNTWLHREVMRRLAQNGGKVPASLLGT